MDAEYFWIECAGCRLTWKMSLMECEIGHALACPFCGNQHYERKAASAGVFEEQTENPAEDAVATGRRLSADNDRQFTWF